MKVFRRHLLSILILLLATGIVMAQPACPSVSAGPDVTLSCGVTCTTLTATPLMIGATSTYKDTQITYSPQPYSGTPVLIHTDDLFTDSIALPFKFCFYGITYNEVMIGANGVLSFTDTNANGHNNFTINGPIPSVQTPPDIFNAILAPWQDLDPTLQGNIYYQVIGTAPCRMFVVSWDSVPLYGSLDSRDPSNMYCGGTYLYTSSQVILYETSNIIDILIAHKDDCPNWNGGNAIEGILNSNGTAADTVAGRNAAAWTAQNDARRFTPSGAPNYTLVWTENGTPIATTDTVTVCPNTLNATYTVTAVYQPCGGGAPVVVSDSVQVSHATNWLAEITSSQNVTCTGLNNGSASASIIGNSTGVTYQWETTSGGTIQGAVGTSTLTVDSLPAGQYDFVASKAGCTQVQTVTINVSSANTLVANPTASNATCNSYADGEMSANPSGGTPPYTFNWSYNGGKADSITGLPVGTYSVTVTDVQGCSVTASDAVHQPPALVIGASATPVSCQGSKDGAIQVQINGGTPPYNASASQDGFIFYSADTAGNITGLIAGNWTVYVIDNNGCSATYPITVPDATPDNYAADVVSTSCYYPPYNDGEASISYSGTNTPYSFAIDSGPLQSDYQFFNLSAGKHTIMAVNGHGCDTTFEIVIPQPLPISAAVTPDSITIALDSSATVTVTYQNDSIPSFLWTPSLGLSCFDCQSPVISPFVSTGYIVYVMMMSNGKECYDSTNLYVTVEPHKPLYIPNSFTPNGDGHNDVFEIYGQGIKTVDLKIFDRWGQMVFQSDDQFQGWDGRFKGQLLMPQVLIYDANVTFLDNTTLEKKGSITLLR